MKRSAPLRRITALKRTGIKRKRARGVDPNCRAAVLARDGGCRAATTVREVRCWGRLDPHHLRRRSQGGSDDPSNLIILCRAHHDWVHQHPEAASVLGLLYLSRP